MGLISDQGTSLETRNCGAFYRASCTRSLWCAALLYEMKEIQLTKGYSAMVDDADFEWLSQWKWYAAVRETTVYASRGIKYSDGRWGVILMHRVIMGTTDRKVLVDHRNGDGLDNTRANIRLCTNSQNGMNRGGLPGSSSRYKGVHFNKKRNRWIASIKVDETHSYLGAFYTEEDAARAYNYAANVYFGEYAKYNEVLPLFLEIKLTTRKSAYSNNTSGFRGVRFEKSSGKWRAEICHNGKRLSIGRFASSDEAAMSYDAKAAQLLGCDAILNFTR